MIKKWKLLKSETAYESPYITLYKEILQRSDGRIIEDFYSVKRRDAVFIVGVTQEKQVLIVQQYKNGVKEVIWELPAGFVDENEDPQKAAERELLEETGYKGKEIRKIGSFVPNTGVSSNLNHVFLILGVEKVDQQKLDEHEEIHAQLFPFDDLVANIKQKKSFFVDTQSQLSLLLAEEELNK